MHWAHPVQSRHYSFSVAFRSMRPSGSIISTLLAFNRYSAENPLQRFTLSALLERLRRPGAPADCSRLRTQKVVPRARVLPFAPGVGCFYRVGRFDEADVKTNKSQGVYIKGTHTSLVG